MAFEHTLSIIKPDGVERQLIGPIIASITAADLRVVALKFMKLYRQEASSFYTVHYERPFFQELLDYMSRSPVVPMVLAGENAVARYRELMGDTDPKKAAPGTLRAEYGLSIQENTVHGTDSVDKAMEEIGFFFGRPEVFTEFYVES